MTEDVLVIGAGPVGMTAAINLLRFGIKPRLVDKRAATVEHSNAVGVQVRTQEVLEALGVIDAFAAAGYRQEWLSVHAFGQPIGRLQVNNIDSPYRGLLSVGQNVTERLLSEHLKKLGQTIERPVTATSFVRDGEEAIVTLRHPDGREEAVRARYVISCEGSGSMVRQSLGIPFEGARYEREVFVQTDAVLRWSYPRGVYMFLNEGLAVILSPYNEKDLYRVICAMPDPDPSNQNPPTLDEMQDYVQRGADPTATLSDPIWLTRYRTQHRRADRFRDGNAFLAGDAGHVHVPIGGQGMNTGIQDGFNLTWKLASVLRGYAPPHILDSYQTERHPVAEALLKSTDTAFQGLLRPSGSQEWAIKHLGPIALRMHAVEQKLADATAEINIAYGESLLVQDNGGSDGPKAGSRAPDAIIVRAPERLTTRLFELFHGPRWTLLLFTGKEGMTEGTRRDLAVAVARVGPWQEQVAAHILSAGPVPPHFDPGAPLHFDREHFAHDKYGASQPMLYLVRPDWYIGFRGPLADVDNLTDYLSAALAVNTAVQVHA